MVSDIYWLYTCAKKERKEKITMWFWFRFIHWMESDGKISSKPHIVSGFCESKENMIAWNVHKNHVIFRCLHFHQNSKRKKRKNSVQARGMAPYKETECSVYGWYLTYEICASPLVQSHMPLSSPQQITVIPVRSSWLRTYLHTQLLIVCYFNYRCAITMSKSVHCYSDLILVFFCHLTTQFV